MKNCAPIQVKVMCHQTLYDHRRSPVVVPSNSSWYLGFQTSMSRNLSSSSRGRAPQMNVKC